MSFAPSPRRDRHISSLVEEEADLIWSVEWPPPGEKATKYIQGKSGSKFKVTIKFLPESMIPIKFTYANVSKPSPYRISVVITEDFDIPPLDNFKNTITTLFTPDSASATIDFGINPRDLCTDDDSNQLYISIKIEKLRGEISQYQFEKHITAKKKLKVRHTSDDDDFQISDDESYSQRSDVLSRSAIQKAAKQMQIEAFLNEDEVFEIDGIAAPYAGIKNQGATCYMNSFLQVLYHIPLFRKVIYSIPSESEPDDSIVLNIQRLFGFMQLQQNPVDTTKLTKSFGWTVNDTNVQHDIEEFSRALMAAIKSKVSGTAKKVIERMFDGEMEVTISFPQYGKSEKKIESFDDMPVAVKGQSDLRSSLLKSNEIQVIDKYKDDAYGLTTAHISNRVTHFPDVLMLHLQRFDIDLKSSELAKINTRFQFPTTIDLSFLKSDETKDSHSDIFSLMGVIVHSGNPIGGHYYSYLKTGDNDKWYLFNDTKVNLVTEEKAINNNFGGVASFADGAICRGTHNKVYSAYMLIYVRRDKLASIYAPITADVIPSHIKNYIKNQLLIEEEKTAAESTINLNISTIKNAAINIASGFDPMDNIAASYNLVLRDDANLDDLYTTAAQKSGSSPESIRLWQCPSQSIVSLIPRNKTISSNKLVTSKIFLEVCPDPEAPPLFFFMVYFDPLSPLAPFKTICTLPANYTDTPLSMLAALCASSGLAVPKGALCFGQLSPGNLTKVQPSFKFSELGLGNGSMLVFQVQPGMEVPSIPHTAFLSVNGPPRESVWYFEVFPQKLPELASEAFDAYNRTVTLGLLSKKTGQAERVVKAPASLEFEDLKYFIADVTGKSYNEKLYYAFFYRKQDNIPIDEDSYRSIGDAFKPSPAVNLVQMLQIEQEICPNKERDVRIIIHFSSDAVHITRRFVRIFYHDQTVSDVLAFFRNKFHLDEDRQLRAVNVIDSKIKNLISENDLVSQTINPIRVEIVPQDQQQKKGRVLARVSFVGKDPKRPRRASGVPFYLRIIPEEPFGQTKERIKRMTEIPDAEFAELTFTAKMKNGFGHVELNDNIILSEAFSNDDRIYINYPGSGAGAAQKRRKESANVPLKINH